MTSLRNLARIYRWMIVAIAALVVILPFQNCGSNHARNEQFSSETLNINFYQGEAMKVLNARCTSCHNPSAPPNTGPSNITDVDKLILDQDIVPGKPQTSVLYLSIVDGIMPGGGIVLNEKEIAAISDWIWILGNPSATAVIPGSVTIPSGGGGGDAPTYTRVRGVIQARCIGCHGAGSPNRSLADYAAVRTTVNPGQPTMSLLYSEVNTNSMPQGGAPLSAVDKLLIFNWIAAGAQNN